MYEFQLDEDESLDKRCAEIFLTSKGRTTLHCTLCCEGVFLDFVSYQAHLNQIHISTKLELDFRPIDLEKETFELTRNLEDYLDVELEGFENTLEEMLTTTANNVGSNETFSVKNRQKSKIQRKREKRRKAPKAHVLEKFIAQNEALKKSKVTELKIPEKIREIRFFNRPVHKVRPTSEEDRKHKCPICGFGFKERGNMLHHFKRHSNERNHACSECDMKFYSSTELNSHKRRHTKDRPLLCTVCGRTFATQSVLTSHLKRHRDQRDYLCPYPDCNKAFYGSTLLKNHMLSHSSERRFPCSMCNAAFKRSIALKNHMKLHENKREYKCQYCEAGFNQQAGLFSHLKSAHKSF